MSKPKRHHFVPQFYLKRFSSGKRFIRCWHKSSALVVPHASIKGQCAINNFYGWHDNIEWSLGIIEGKAASIFRQIDTDVMLPDSRSPEWQEILIFIALQSSRTQLSGRESDEIADYYYKLMLQHEAHLAGIDLNNFRIGSRFPAAFPMQIAMQAFPELNKLDSCLLINNSKTPFLTSDNPVVYYNGRYSKVDYMGVIGLTSLGLQIFYPISPSLMIVIFDPDSYKRPSNTGLKFVRESDVIQLNMIHYMWSGEVVFWNSEEFDPSIRTIANHCDSYLPFERTKTTESERIETGDDEMRSLMHSFRAHAPIETNLMFVKANGSSIPTGNLIRGSNPMPLEAGGREYKFVTPAQPRRHLKNGRLHAAIRDLTTTSRKSLA